MEDEAGRDIQAVMGANHVMCASKAIKKTPLTPPCSDACMCARAQPLNKPCDTGHARSMSDVLALNLHAAQLMHPNKTNKSEETQKSCN